MSTNTIGRDTPPALLGRQARELGDRPLFTALAGDLREELGWVTADNWVTKTANLMIEEVELSRGQRVLTALPPGWPAAVVTLGCWRAGLQVAAVGPDEAAQAAAGAHAAVVTEAALAGLGHPGVPVFAVGAGLGARMTAAPVPGVLPFTDEVLACGDQWLGEEAATDDPAWVDGGTRTQGEMLATGEALAVQALRSGDRLLVDEGAGGPLGRARGLCAALSAGASMVLVGGAHDFLVALDQEGPDVALVSPGGLEALTGRERVSDAAGETLRAVYVLDDVGDEVLERAHDRLGLPVEVAAG